MSFTEKEKLMNSVGGIIHLPFVVHSHRLGARAQEKKDHLLHRQVPNRRGISAYFLLFSAFQSQAPIWLSSKHSSKVFRATKVVRNAQPNPQRKAWLHSCVLKKQGFVSVCQCWGLTMMEVCTLTVFLIILSFFLFTPSQVCLDVVSLVT